MRSLLVTIVIVIISIIIVIVGFGISYKLFLRKLIAKIPKVGDWIIGQISNIPLLGGWLNKEGYNNLLNNSVAIRTYTNKNAELGTRVTKRLGHGRACAWDNKLCNVHTKSSLAKISGGDKDVGTLRNEAAIELRAQKYQAIQEPARRKVLYKSFKVGPGLNNAPGSFADIIAQQTSVMTKARNKLGAVDGNGIKNGSELSPNIGRYPSM